MMFWCECSEPVPLIYVQVKASGVLDSAVLFSLYIKVFLDGQIWPGESLSDGLNLQRRCNTQTSDRQTGHTDDK